MTAWDRQLSGSGKVKQAELGTDPCNTHEEAWPPTGSQLNATRVQSGIEGIAHMYIFHLLDKSTHQYTDTCTTVYTTHLQTTKCCESILLHAR